MHTWSPLGVDPSQCTDAHYCTTVDIVNTDAHQDWGIVSFGTTINLFWIFHLQFGSC